MLCVDFDRKIKIVFSGMVKLTKLCGSKDKETTTRANKIITYRFFDMSTTTMNSTDVAALSTNVSVPSKHMLTLLNLQPN